jgi:signal transduction histidine kinase
MLRQVYSRLAVVAVAIMAVVLGVTFLLFHLFTPFDGARLAPGHPYWSTAGVVVTPIERQAGGLAPGDVVVAVAGKSMEAWAQALFQPGLARPQWHVGETVTYTVLRSGKRLEVPVTLEPYPLGAIVLHEWSTVLFALVFLLVGLFVFLLRPDDRAARVQLVMAASITGATTWSLGLQVGDLVSGTGFWLYIATTFGVYTLFWVGILHFVLVFPRPHPAIVNHPWTIPLIYVAPYILSIAYLFVAWLGAATILDWMKSWDSVESILPAAYLVLTILLAIWGYRTLPTTADRQKIRWLVFASLVSGGGILLLWYLPALLLGQPVLGSNGLGLLALPYPLILPVVILRYRLFDIDVIINRTLVYGLLTTLIVCLYVAVVNILGAVLHSSGSPINSLAATGLIAILFEPLRSRLQRMINRLMYGERDEPYAVLSRLGSRLEATLAPETVLPTIVETVASALKLPYAAITMSKGGSLSAAPAASFGLPQDDLLTLPLMYQSETIGALVLARRAPGDAFTAADRRLLHAIAQQAGVAVHAVQLTADLQLSRERLVTTREEERRRLRRDLHDGLGPALASLTFKIDAAHNLLAEDRERAEMLLAEVRQQVQQAIADIRRLVYGLRPPTLDEFGLLSALQEQAAQYQHEGFVVDLDIPRALPTLPAAVEVAVYRISQEAFVNVARHAAAKHCQLRLAIKVDTLCLDISDDGKGIPASHNIGVGLHAMHERASELGGSCIVTQGASGGTLIQARLPLTRALEPLSPS